MSLALNTGVLENAPTGQNDRAPDLARYIPREVLPLDNPQTDIPRIAKDERLIRLIEEAVCQIPTTHTLTRGDARDMNDLKAETVHLVVTSPPYWTLKEYRDSLGQMGHIEDYEEFLAQLDMVWSHCFRALVPGGRLVCVVGDVCLSRRKNNGRHTVVPLHASIQASVARLAEEPDQGVQRGPGRPPISAKISDGIGSTPEWPN
jgi:hypothetical protein